jgi:protein SCO1/2
MIDPPDPTPSSAPAAPPAAPPPGAPLPGAPRRTVLPPLLLGLALLVLAVVAIRRALRPPPAGTGPDVAAAELRGKVLADWGEVADFELIDQHGRAFTKKDLAGRIWLLDFFFTTCSGPCIDLTTKMRSLVAALGGEEDVGFISLSVDPAADRPTTLQAYARAMGGGSDRWIWLTSRDGDEAPVKTLAASFYAPFGAKDEAGQLTHSTRINLIDRHGRIRAICDTQIAESWKDDVLHAVRLLLEQQPRADAPAADAPRSDAPAGDAPRGDAPADDPPAGG